MLKNLKMKAEESKGMEWELLELRNRASRKTVLLLSVLVGMRWKSLTDDEIGG